MTTLSLPSGPSRRADPNRAAINSELQRGHTVVTFTRLNARQHKVTAVYHPWTRH